MATCVTRATRNPDGRHGKTTAQIYAYDIHRHPVLRMALFLLSLVSAVIFIVYEPPSYRHVTVLSWGALRRPLLIAEIVVQCVFLLDCALRFFHIAFVWDPVLNRYRIEISRFFNQHATVVSTACTILLIVDASCALGIQASAATVSISNVRFARILRPIIIVCRLKALRQFSRVILLTLPRILDFLALIIVIMFVFAVVGTTLFSGLYSESKTDSFEGIIRSMFTLWILISTESYPDATFQAYDANNGYIAFFILYLLVTTFLLMPYMLSLTENAYEELQKERALSEFVNERLCLARAFSLLTSQHW